MSPGTITKVISASLGLSAFATAVVVGLWVDNPAETILVRALLSTFIAQGVGMALGAAGERAVQDHLNAIGRPESARVASSAQSGAAHAGHK